MLTSSFIKLKPNPELVRIIVTKSISLKSGSYGSVSYVNDNFVKKTLKVDDSLNLFSAIKEWFCNQRLLNCPGIHNYIAMNLNYQTMEIDFYSNNFLYSYNRIIHEIEKERLSLKKDEFHDTFINKSKQVLELLHSKNIVHNDIKHDNVMFDNSIELYFIDFGIAFVKCKNVYNLGHVRAAKYISPPEVIFSKQEYLYTTDKSFIDLYALGVLAVNSYNDSFPMYELKGEEGKVSYPRFLESFYGSHLHSKDFVDFTSSSSAIQAIQNKEIRTLVNQLLQPNPKLRFFYDTLKISKDSLSGNNSINPKDSWIPHGKLFVNIWEEVKNLECYNMKSHSLAPFLAMEMFTKFTNTESKQLLIACLYIAVSIYASSLYFLDYNIPLSIKITIMQVMGQLSDSISEMEDTLIVRKFMEDYPENKERPNINYILLFPILREYPKDLKTLDYLISGDFLPEDKLQITESLEKRWVPMFYSEMYQSNVFIPWSKFFSSFPLDLIHEKLANLKIKN